MNCETCRDAHEVEEQHEEKVDAPGSPSGHRGVERAEMVACPDCCIECDFCGRLAHDLEPGYRQLADRYDVEHWCDADCLEAWLEKRPALASCDALFTALDVSDVYTLRIAPHCAADARADTQEGLLELTRTLLDEAHYGTYPQKEGLGARVRRFIARAYHTLWSDEEKAG